MIFKRIEPQACYRDFIACYWFIEDDSNRPQKQKIIPDGFTEMIFHFADPFRICLDGRWKTQERSLVAGQIRKHFYIENTGLVDVMGVKLKPTALTRLFSMDMSKLTDKVVGLEIVESDDAFNKRLSLLSHHERIDLFHNSLEAYFSSAEPAGVVDKAVEIIGQHNGVISVSEVAEKVATGERHLERLFKRYVGLSPKLYARTMRFNYIFDSVKVEKDWMSIVEKSGFYDQPHFSKDFKSFTGEEPSAWMFDARNMANFFAGKSGGNIE
jgi:AraC-like DNA-binding protein